MNALEKKIAFSFGAVSVAFLLMTLLTLTQVNQLTESSRRIQYSLEPSIKANLRLTLALNTSIISLQNWLLTGEEHYQRQRQALWSAIEKNHKQLQNYAQHWNNAEHLDLLPRITQDLEQLQQLQALIEQAAHSAEHAAALERLKQQHAPLGQRLMAQLRQISDPQHWEMQRVFQTEEAQEKTLKDTALLFFTLSVVGGISLAILLARAVIIPLNRTIYLAGSIARGDYTLDSNFSSGEKKLDLALGVMIRQLQEKDQRNKQQQQTLARYNKQLKISNEELSQFSYRTSHDLKAPLVTVRGLAEAIVEDLDAGDDQEAKKNARTISQQVQKLESLVVDILDLARADLAVTHNEHVNMANLVCEIQERLNSVYIDTDVVVITEIEPGIELYLSKVRMMQVLENLISNAIKYSDPAKASRFVKVSITQQAQQAVCRVEDNGIGIPKQFAHQAFEMFQRFHPQIAYGSGLGMYIIKKHIDKMGGQISFTSSEDGTCFTIELPSP